MANEKPMDEWKTIERINMSDTWVNTAYDEDGNAVLCDLCEAEMQWLPAKKLWVCPECERAMGRRAYFDYIGADPPGEMCISSCTENYPFCKKHCRNYEISKDDPMMD